MADIDIEFEVEGLEEFKRFFREDVPDAIDEGVNNALEELRNDIENRVTELCPVDTGALLDSINIELTGDYGIDCTAGMDYASFVDEGTRKMRAEPYFHDPINELFNEFDETLEESLDSSLQNIG